MIAAPMQPRMCRWPGPSLGVTLSLLLLLGSCGEERADHQAPAPLEDTKTPPPEDTSPPPTGLCAEQPAGTACEDGDPCTVDDVCNEQGLCVGGASRICPEEDGNLCTEPVCRSEDGGCTEAPIDGVEVNGICFRQRCEQGSPVTLGPAPANDCAERTVPEGGCLDSYVCDAEYEGRTGDRCRPIVRPNGAHCLGSTPTGSAGVAPATTGATDTEPSACTYYVCYSGEGPDAAAQAPACVLASTLPTAVQSQLSEAGSVLRHQCHWSDLPEAISPDCNDWLCGCRDGACLQPECQVLPKEAMAAQACDSGNLCDGSICEAAPGGYFACTGENTPPVICDLFPEASCDVVAACDPATGCPSALDAAASNAQCWTGNPCQDVAQSQCAPGDPAADPASGCVLTDLPAGTSCLEAVAGPCVLAAQCLPQEEGLSCVITETVQKESTLCDQLDEDCDGITDEDCQLELRGARFGDGAGAASDGSFHLQHRLGAPRFGGSTTDGAHTIHSGLPVGEKP